ncbi:flippase [Butyrivibrio sp. X503]|uniref:flippase n=1 Tax=Butyrivibrio sp. X503 TaxID=2364878 RepID=UPI000EA91F06|nr:flippase [Butyrivibrio sp. X503]RKM53805.1 flippase [Butyrivibrio sp. X503]
MSKLSSTKTNFIFNSIYQLSNILVPLVTMPYLSRVLGADGLGEYAYAYSVAFYFTIFIKLGLNNYGNRTIAYVKDDKKELSKTFWEIYSFQFILGVILFSVYAIYSLTLAPNKMLGIMMGIYVFSSLIDVNWCLYGLEKFKVTSTRDVLTKILTMVCIFIFVKRPEDVWLYALFFSGGMLLNQIVVIPLLNNEISFCKVSAEGVIKHIKPNLVLFIPVVAVSIYRTMDKIMLGVLSTDSELGYYHSAENVIRVPMAFVNALGIVMLPRMSNMLARGDSKKSMESTFDKSIIVAMFLATSICFGIMTVSKEFVPIFYGPGFDKCNFLFYIILPGSMFEAFANVIRTQYLIPRKKDKIYVFSLIMGATLNLILNLILIPKYASVGASIGTFVAYATVCIVQAVCVFKEANIGRNILNSLPFVIAGVLMFVLLWQYTPKVSNEILALMVKIVMGGVVYLGSLAVFMGVSRLKVARSD